MAKARKGTESQITRMQLGNYTAIIDPVAGTVQIGSYLTVTKDKVREIYDRLNALPAEEPVNNFKAPPARTENDQAMPSIPNDDSNSSFQQQDTQESASGMNQDQDTQKDFGGFGGGDTGGAGADQDYSDSQNQGSDENSGAGESGSDSGNDSGSDSSSSDSSDSGSFND